MSITQRVLTLAFAALCFAAGGIAQAPAQGQPGAVSPSVWNAPPAGQAGQASSSFQSACGNQPMCYDAPDFAVAVVDFRMSVTNGWKVMDATLRFVNKTNQPLILGYLDTSAMALDDQGNRYAPYGNRNLAGIGIVSGNSGDPKFQLAPGGAGDARWELIWHPGAQDPIGSTFELDMTIREMNTLTGGAHALGAEVPLRFQGLANGMTGASATASAYTGAPGATGVAGVASASPMLATGTSSLPPCPPAGTAGTVNAVAGAANSVGGQQTAAATNTAANTATGAAAALSNLRSIFGKKNASAPAMNAAGAAPCIPAATGAAMPVAAGTSTAPAAAGQVAGAAPATATAPAGKPAAAMPAAQGKVPATAATTGAAGRVPAASNVAKTAAPTRASTTAPAKPAAVVNTAAPNAKPATQAAATNASTQKAVPAPAQKPPTPAQPANKKPAPTTADAKKPATR